VIVPEIPVDTVKRIVDDLLHPLVPAPPQNDRVPDLLRYLLG
jgi:hypothetical protein